MMITGENKVLAFYGFALKYNLRVLVISYWHLFLLPWCRFFRATDSEVCRQWKQKEIQFPSSAMGRPKC